MVNFKAVFTRNSRARCLSFDGVIALWSGVCHLQFMENTDDVKDQIFFKKLFKNIDDVHQ